MKKITLTLFSVCFLLFGAYSQKANSHIDKSGAHKCSSHKCQSHQKIAYKQTSLLNNYDVKFYKLDIKMENNSTYVSGNVIYDAVVMSAVLDTFAFELITNLSVDSVKINNVISTFTRQADETFVKVNPSIALGNSFRAQIYYHGDPSVGGGFFSGISTDSSNFSWNNHVTWTLSEPFNAKQWWPCKQVLTDKADSVHIFITTSSTNKAGSNGLLTAVTPMPNGKSRYEWKSNYPINYYLISAAVSNYDEYNIYAKPTGLQDSILIQNYIYPGCLGTYQVAIDETADMIELFSDLMSMYPFKDEKYGHCLAPLGGGMEHQTMTTLGYFQFWLIAHELGHMWWGDNVTCATWSDIWINEGFASYTEYLAAQYLQNQASADGEMLGVHNNVMSLPDGSVYIPPAMAVDDGRIFDGRLSYDKGSAIIHMIRFELQNDTVFFNTLRNFQTQYKDSNASGMDFKNVLETTSGMNFTDFFDQWYFGEGYPVYNISWHQSHPDTLIMDVNQSTSISITPLFKMLMEYKLQSVAGDTIVRVYQTANSNHFAILVDRAISGIEVDPNNWVLNQVGSITAMQDIDESITFNIYPNPCKDELKINILSNNMGISAQILDITGRVISTQALSNNIINTSELSKGIYFIRVFNENNTLTKKFIKE